MKVEEFIDRMTRISEEEDKLSSEKARLMKPILYDYVLIPDIYNVFVEEARKLKPCLNVSSTDAKRVFLFIILYLYSPRTLFGNKMRKGLRPELKRLFNCDPTVLSYYSRNLSFFYQVYPSFRSNVNILLDAIMKTFVLDEEK